MTGVRPVPLLPRVWIWAVMITSALAGLVTLLVPWWSGARGTEGIALTILLSVPGGMMLWVAIEEWWVLRHGKLPVVVNGLLLTGALLMLFVTALVTLLCFQSLNWSLLGLALTSASLGLFWFFGVVFNEQWWAYLDDANRRREPTCTACGYDLRATPDPWGPLLPRCPECGSLA